MKRPVLIFLVPTVFIIAACSTESLTRTTYETLQGVEQERCRKDWTSKCPERESYDAYRAKMNDPQRSDAAQ
jgi:hypothetical protein